MIVRDDLPDDHVDLRRHDVLGEPFDQVGLKLLGRAALGLHVLDHVLLLGGALPGTIGVTAFNLTYNFVLTAIPLFIFMGEIILRTGFSGKLYRALSGWFQLLPVERYVHPDEFAQMKEEALGLGFKHVESGPLVRSSEPGLGVDAGPDTLRALGDLCAAGAASGSGRPFSIPARDLWGSMGPRL